MGRAIFCYMRAGLSCRRSRVQGSSAPPLNQVLADGSGGDNILGDAVRVYPAA